MRKYFIFAVVILLMIGCNSNKSGKEQELIESLKNEEKTDIANEPESQSVTEQTTQQSEDITNEEAIVDEASLWSSYHSAKEAVKEAEIDNDYKTQAKHLLEAANFANALQRYDIEAWQYNNAGYALIEDFKAKTDYLSVMDVLNKLELKSEIIEYRKETRAFMSNEKDLLTEAAKHLAKAKEIDDKLEKSSRTTIIANNNLFVNDVLNFLDVKDTE